MTRNHIQNIAVVLNASDLHAVHHYLHVTSHTRARTHTHTHTHQCIHGDNDHYIASLKPSTADSLGLTVPGPLLEDMFP